jgi:hypothetical protein
MLVSTNALAEIPRTKRHEARRNDEITASAAKPSAAAVPTVRRPWPGAGDAEGTGKPCAHLLAGTSLQAYPRIDTIDAAGVCDELWVGFRAICLEGLK